MYSDILQMKSNRTMEIYKNENAFYLKLKIEKLENVQIKCLFS